MIKIPHLINGVFTVQHISNDDKDPSNCFQVSRLLHRFGFGNNLYFRADF